MPARNGWSGTLARKTSRTALNSLMGQSDLSQITLGRRLKILGPLTEMDSALFDCTGELLQEWVIHIRPRLAEIVGDILELMW